MPNNVIAYAVDRTSALEAIETLTAQIQAYSDWRRGAAEKYPDDDRHGDAASVADDLVSSMSRVPDHLASRLAQRLDGDPTFRDELNTAVKDLGFTQFPSTATAFLVDLLGV